MHVTQCWSLYRIRVTASIRISILLKQAHLPPQSLSHKSAKPKSGSRSLRKVYLHHLARLNGSNGKSKNTREKSIQEIVSQRDYTPTELRRPHYWKLVYM